MFAEFILLYNLGNAKTLVDKEEVNVCFPIWFSLYLNFVCFPRVVFRLSYSPLFNFLLILHLSSPLILRKLAFMSPLMPHGVWI